MATKLKLKGLRWEPDEVEAVLMTGAKPGELKLLRGENTTGVQRDAVFAKLRERALGAIGPTAGTDMNKPAPNPQETQENPQETQEKPQEKAPAGDPRIGMIGVRLHPTGGYVECVEVTGVATVGRRDPRTVLICDVLAAEAGTQPTNCDGLGVHAPITNPGCDSDSFEGIALETGDVFFPPSGANTSLASVCEALTAMAVGVWEPIHGTPVVGTLYRYFAPRNGFGVGSSSYLEGTVTAVQNGEIAFSPVSGAARVIPIATSAGDWYDIPATVRAGMFSDVFKRSWTLRVSYERAGKSFGMTTIGLPQFAPIVGCELITF